MGCQDSWVPTGVQDVLAVTESSDRGLQRTGLPLGLTQTSGRQGPLRHQCHLRLRCTVGKSHPVCLDSSPAHWTLLCISLLSGKASSRQQCRTRHPDRGQALGLAFPPVEPDRGLRGFRQFTAHIGPPRAPCPKHRQDDPATKEAGACSTCWGHPVALLPSFILRTCDRKP